MSEPDDDEFDVDKMGENLADLLRQNREEAAVIARIAERVEDIHDRLVTGKFPFLPPQRPRWNREDHGGGAR